MSTGQRKGKQTKGKQKIEMKKVEAYADRMITFSKRKSGIYKKLNEIVTMCDTDVAFLVFSEAGKPYTFAHPSIEKVASRLMNFTGYEPSTEKEDTMTSLVEAYKKQKIMNLMKEYMTVAEDLDMEKEKEKMSKKSINEVKQLEQMWWNHSLKGMSVEELERRHQTFEELYNTMCDMAILQLKKTARVHLPDVASVDNAAVAHKG